MTVAVSLASSTTPGIAGLAGWSLEPDMVREGWVLLGYDVADAALLSGLSNCGYTADELPALRAVWAPALNGHHLFDDSARAEGFRALTDERVPEHAPFYVFGIYRVEDA